MTLDDHLSAEVGQSESLFRAAMAREDVARVSKLRQLATQADDFDAFAKQALFVGWTAGDLRSRDLEPAVRDLAAAVWAETTGRIEPADLLAAWHAFNAERMRILIHCL